MSQQRFTPHSRSCIDPDCTGKCAVLRDNEKGEVVLHPVVPDPPGAAPIGRDLIQHLLSTGAINAVACIWEDTNPSYTIQLLDEYKPGQVADLVKLMSHLGLPVRFVTHMTGDCIGRRIF